MSSDHKSAYNALPGNLSYEERIAVIELECNMVHKRMCSITIETKEEEEARLASKARTYQDYPDQLYQ